MSSLGTPTGHLMGKFGQITMKLADYEFDDDKDVVGILNLIFRSRAPGLSHLEKAEAYKLDEAICWEP
eukprot:2644402-Lingulodinium_polyedra.AAC.1